MTEHPKMLYKSLDDWAIADSKSREQQLKEDGFMLFDELHQQFKPEKKSKRMVKKDEAT